MNSLNSPNRTQTDFRAHIYAAAVAAAQSCMAHKQSVLNYLSSGEYQRGAKKGLRKDWLFLQL